jgi:hypothetical protein
MSSQSRGPNFSAPLWASALALALTFAASVSVADTLVMPRELVDFARSQGCTPIDEFYERPAMINPPYVYGFASGDAENSAALWCRKLEKSDEPYLLLLKVAREELLGGCPPRIEYWNYPKGLSVQTMTSLNLSEFRVAVDPKHHGPRIVVPTAKVIVSEYDGLEEVFLCYRGAWLIRTRE